MVRFSFFIFLKNKNEKQSQNIITAQLRIISEKRVYRGAVKYPVFNGKWLIIFLNTRVTTGET
jgi:hypothetical protein